MLRPLEPERVKALITSAEKVEIPKEHINAALQLLKDHIEVYQGVSAHLLHGDYGPKHILVEDDCVTGVIDFENCKSGDPLYDFAWWSYFQKGRPSINWLNDGYEKMAKRPDDYEIRLRLYRLRLGAEMIWYYETEKHTLGISIAKVNLREDLEYFGQVLV